MNTTAMYKIKLNSTYYNKRILHKRILNPPSRSGFSSRDDQEKPEKRARALKRLLSIDPLREPRAMMDTQISPFSAPIHRFIRFSSSAWTKAKEGNFFQHKEKKTGFCRELMGRWGSGLHETEHDSLPLVGKREVRGLPGRPFLGVDRILSSGKHPSKERAVLPNQL
ncbi:hypothetical protein CEXT_441581 [Caerostris extrusa]|uniref:Uncharacterized protein n=1 Tax=Caerostris extrusa TaxID=172846 RepID=A0AAV4X6C0_CAEEX|nr:hypothetical protein CEXT_441581 [Caerostris extrusa]